MHAFLDDFLLLEDFEQVPGDGFAFAIRVGRQNELVGALNGVRDLANNLLRAAVDLHFISKSCSGATEPSFDGKSRTCPNEAITL